MLQETILNSTKMISKVRTLPRADTEEGILYLLPVVATAPSCTSWSRKSLGSNRVLLGLEAREGCKQPPQHEMCSHFLHPHSLLVTKRPPQHMSGPLQDVYWGGFFSGG